MDFKSLTTSTEVLAGIGLIVAGLLAQFAGMHSVLAIALAPFGLGLILSDVLTQIGRATRKRVKVYIRRDDDRPNRRR